MIRRRSTTDTAEVDPDLEWCCVSVLLLCYFSSVDDHPQNAYSIHGYASSEGDPPQQRTPSLHGPAEDPGVMKTELQRVGNRKRRRPRAKSGDDM